MTKRIRYSAGTVSGRKMTKQEIKERFNKTVAENYIEISKGYLPFLPDYGYSFKLLADFVSSNVPKNAKILDLGAGTGNLSKVLLEKNASCKLTLMDFSQNMLSQVPKVLSKFSNRYETLQADLFNKTLGNCEYDAVISSLAIHHGRGEKVYAKLYENIYNALKPNGIFVCCDVVDSDFKEVDSQCIKEWKEHLKKHFSKEDIKKLFIDFKAEDSPLSVRNHLKQLEKAGFKRADVLWKKCNFAVYTAIKE